MKSLKRGIVVFRIRFASCEVKVFIFNIYKVFPNAVFDFVCHAPTSRYQPF